MRHDTQAKKPLKVAGLRHTTIHDLRHGGASLIRDAGGTLQDSSEILGHSRLSVTSDFYKHLSVEAQAVSMDKLGQALQ